MSVETGWLHRVGWRPLAVGAAAALAVGTLLGWRTLSAGGGAAPPASTAAAPVADAPMAADLLVFVSGAVSHPGLYQLSAAARVADAIAAAGGMTADADTGRLPDLASRVHDGRQVNVPFIRSGSSRQVKLDINSATVDELDGVPGMPPGLAAAIVEYRDQWGPFTSLSQLRSELGVDSETQSAVSHYLRVVVPAA